MDDLISRQAAIDAIYKCTDIYVTNLPPMIDKAEAYKAISDLPSAQPEIIHCRNCKYQDKGSNEKESWNLCGYRPWMYVPTHDDHYCGYAKRRTDEHN